MLVWTCERRVGWGGCSLSGDRVELKFDDEPICPLFSV
jgi:hypothetical protein